MTLASSPAKFSPLRRNLKEQLVRSLGIEIVAGRLRPGDVLPSEGVLLARYEISRTVLREAVNVLTAKGLLDTRPKRGTMIKAPSSWSQLDPDVLAWREAGHGEIAQVDESMLDQLMEVRRLIEPGAAALAAARATPKDLSEMELAYGDMESASTAEEFMEADLAFHLACLHAGRNDFLMPVAHAIRSAMLTSLHITNKDPQENREVSLPLHRAILDAVVAGDSAAARSAMETHLDDTEHRRSRERLAG
jgi:DNA-binding FadR family transcriptional regulator